VPPGEPAEAAVPPFSPFSFFRRQCRAPPPLRAGERGRVPFPTVQVIKWAVMDIERTLFFFSFSPQEEPIPLCQFEKNKGSPFPGFPPAGRRQWTDSLPSSFLIRRYSFSFQFFFRASKGAPRSQGSERPLLFPPGADGAFSLRQRPQTPPFLRLGGERGNDLSFLLSRNRTPFPSRHRKGFFR